MKINVCAAHYTWRPDISRSRISRSLDKLLGWGKSPLKLRAEGALFPKIDDNKIGENLNEDNADTSIFDHLYPQCSEEERRILRLSLYKGRQPWQDRPSVDLEVEPNLTVGALKSLLKSEPWIPKENLVLSHRERSQLFVPLEDDSSTLEKYGLKEDEGLLSCMGGSFTVTVHHVESDEEYFIPVSSCFETTNDLKKKIYGETGLHPSLQRLHLHRKQCQIYGGTMLKSHATPLVVLGIVRPHSSNMQKSSNMIKLVIDDLKKYWES